MKLEDLRDANGTNLESYATSLLEKCAEHDLLVAIVFAKKVEGEPDFLHTVANVDLAKLPLFLHQLAEMMRSTSGKTVN